MAKFKIPVVFTVCAEVVVKANNYDEAATSVEQSPLPPKDTWTYLNDSFEVDCDSGEYQQLNEITQEFETKNILDS